MWRFLQEDLKLVEASIDDCKDSFTAEEYEEHCQLLLRSSAGINFREFFELIQLVAQHQMEQIKRISLNNNNNNNIDFVSNFNLELFSLFRILPVLQDLLSHPSMKKYHLPGHSLFEEIQEILYTFLSIRQQ
jgi:hypothetical protein